MMTKPLLLIAALALLTACGADGEPERPEKKTTETGITVSGRAAVGVIF